MTTADLVALRKALDLGQVEMAKRMGLSLRPYQELEAETRQLRSRHVRLAESVALEVAIENEDPELAPIKIRQQAIELARLIIRRNFRQKASRLAKMLLEED